MGAKLDQLAQPRRTGRRPAVSSLTFIMLFVAFVGLNIFLPEAMSATEIQLGADHVLTLWGTNLGLAAGIGMILSAVFFTWLDQRES